jgi:hypothetical protein
MIGLSGVAVDGQYRMINCPSSLGTRPVPRKFGSVNTLNSSRVRCSVQLVEHSSGDYKAR